jgi:hypothetical protein
MDHLFGGRYFMELTKNAHLYRYLSEGGDLTAVALEGGGWLRAYLNLGRVAGEQVFGMAKSGVPLGFPAELFAIAGWPLLVLGMATVGYLLRRWTVLIARPSVADYVVALYAMGVTRAGVFLFNNGLGVTVYQMVTDSVPFLLAVLVLKWSASDSPRRSILLR